MWSFFSMLQTVLEEYASATQRPLVKAIVRNVLKSAFKIVHGLGAKYRIQETSQSTEKTATNR